MYEWIKNLSSGSSGTDTLHTYAGRSWYWRHRNDSNDAYCLDTTEVNEEENEGGFIGKNKREGQHDNQMVYDNDAMAALFGEDDEEE